MFLTYFYTNICSFNSLHFQNRLVIWVLMQFRIIDYFYFASLHWSPEGQAKVILFPGDPFANSDLNVFLSCCLILFSICEKSPKLLKLENVKKKKKRFRKKKKFRRRKHFSEFSHICVTEMKKSQIFKDGKKKQLGKIIKAKLYFPDKFRSHKHRRENILEET